MDENPDGTASPASARSSPRDRRLRIFAGTGLAGVVTLLFALALTHGSSTPDRTDSAPAPRSVPVAYEVTGNGTAQITYTQAGATTASTVTIHLPWKHSAHVDPAHGPAAISIILGANGGRATCALTLHDTTVQHATAYGPYGRATCTTDLSAPSH